MAHVDESSCHHISNTWSLVYFIHLHLRILNQIFNTLPNKQKRWTPSLQTKLTPQGFHKKYCSYQRARKWIRWRSFNCFHANL